MFDEGNFVRIVHLDGVCGVGLGDDVDLSPEPQVGSWLAFSFEQDVSADREHRAIQREETRQVLLPPRVLSGHERFYSTRAFFYNHLRPFRP